VRTAASAISAEAVAMADTEVRLRLLEVFQRAAADRLQSRCRFSAVCASRS